METKQQNSWENKQTVIKGNYGENIAKNFIEKLGYVVYKPVTPKAHAFDSLAIKDKKQAIIFEVKTKARRTYYADTGFDYRHFIEYKAISQKHNLPVFIFFVDEFLKKVYGNFLSKLEEPCRIKNIDYPLHQGAIIYFPLARMREIAKLSDNDVVFLKEKSTRNYDYLQ